LEIPLFTIRPKVEPPAVDLAERRGIEEIANGGRAR
jgi:hypothetical protein